MNVREFRNYLGFSNVKSHSVSQKIKEFAVYDKISINDVHGRITEARCIEEEWIKDRDSSEIVSCASYYKSQFVKYQDWDWYYANSEGDYIWTLKELEDMNFDGEILDFGGGNGDLSIAASACGYKVTYSNLPGDQTEFAKWRFKIRGHGITVIGDDHNYETYDCFLAFEVAEHFVKPEVYVKFILHVLRKGGYLIETTSFSQESHGHFAKYKFDGSFIDRRSATRYYRNLLRENFEQIKHGWNSRPVMWRRVK